VSNQSVSVSTKKVRVNQCLLCFESCPPSADLYFGHSNLSASGGFVSPVLRRSSTSEDGDFELRISDLPSYLSPPKVKKCKKMVQKVFIFVNFCKFLLIFANKCK